MDRCARFSPARERRRTAGSFADAGELAPVARPAGALRAANRTIAAALARVAAPPPKPSRRSRSSQRDLRLLLRSPSTAAAGASKYLKPAHWLRLRFVQKLSVRHVSNPLDLSRETFADQP